MIGRTRERQELEAALTVADDAYPAGAQIDMLIERADHVINVCEMKFSSRPFSIEKPYLAQLKTKLGAFEQISKTRSAIHLTLVTSAGLLHNKHSGIVQSEVTLDDLDLAFARSIPRQFCYNTCW